MATVEESKVIQGVQMVSLATHSDNRGWFMETFRKEWFPQRTWDRVQWNASWSAAGVLRGLHYHHHQIDYWFVPSGTIRLGMYDLRPSSPTHRGVQMLEIGDSNRIGVFIPSGVAHGFLALTDAVMNYLVDNYYDGSDECEVAWNDPDIGLDWGAESPVVSARDAVSPLLRDISAERLPG